MSDALNRFLAETFFGWTGQHVLPDFSQLSNIQPLLNQIERDGWRWSIDNYDDRYNCELSRDCDVGIHHNGLVFFATGTNLQYVIGHAIAQAYGWRSEEVMG